MHALKTHSNISTLAKLIAATVLSCQLMACVPAVVGGAAAGGAIAADRRTSGIYVEDENIELKAVKYMATTLGEQSHVNVTSYNRNVLLTGEVPDDAAKANAEAFVKSIENVRNVSNELAVGAGTRTVIIVITMPVATFTFLRSKIDHANNPRKI